MESETTRYLCAGVHLDRAFRHTVLEQMLSEEHKAVAVPHGVNVEPVVHHALLSRKRDKIRSLLLTIVVVAAVFYCFWNQRFAEEVLPLASTTTEGDAQTAVALAMLPFLIPFWLVAALVVLVGDILRNRALRTLRRGRPVVVDASRLANISPDIRDRDQRNVVVYSGFSPFVGSGIDLGGWSFVIRGDKGKEELGVPTEPIPFQNSELYAHIRSTLEGLAVDGLLIQDELYVNGQDIRDDRTFLPNPIGRPVSAVASEIVEGFVNNSSQTVRHYMAVHLIQWKGELVLSCFLRVTQPGPHLFVESSYFLLPPVTEKYYMVDSLSLRMSGKEVIGLAIRAVLGAPFLCCVAPFALWGEMLEPFNRWKKQRETEELIKENYSFDYGATASIRALAASPNYRRYFQKLDKEMGLKLVERSILDSIVGFLDEKNIDTSDLKERTSTILNNGVIVSGRYIKADTFTAGQGATSEVVKQFGATLHGAPIGQKDVNVRK